MPNLKIRVTGICCFVDQNNGVEAKRLVIPLDDMMGGDNHIPFIEVRESDLDGYSGAAPSDHYTHYNGSVYYRRWELSGHCIEIDTIDQSAPMLDTTPSFDRHIPSMKQICPNLRSYPRQECFDENPPPNLIVGCLEIGKGTLDAGPLEEIFTAFSPVYNWPAGQTPQWVDLRMPVLPGKLVISLNAFDTSGAHDAQLTLKEGTENITIGNLLMADLTGPGSGAGRTEHFKLFYNLSDPARLPETLPLPLIPQVPVNACSPVRWS